MFDLHFNSKGEKVLKYVERLRYPGERGMWIEICHENDKEAKFFVNLNRNHGLEVEKDDRGFYRAHVLKD